MFTVGNNRVRTLTQSFGLPTDLASNSVEIEFGGSISITLLDIDIFFPFSDEKFLSQ